MRVRNIELIGSIFVVGALVFCGCEGTRKDVGVAEGVIRPTKRISLFNGQDLDGWREIARSAEEIWWVQDGVIHCKGKPTGYIRTEVDYADYKLYVEWRWVEEGSNSGILVHAVSPDVVFPRCVECQLLSGDAGDFWFIGGTAPEGRSNKYFYREQKREASSEKPLGDWNVAEIYCDGDSIRVFINGVLQNEAKGVLVSSGWICLQSEGGPIEFRNVYIEPLAGR